MIVYQVAPVSKKLIKVTHASIILNNKTISIGDQDHSKLTFIKTGTSTIRELMVAVYLGRHLTFLCQPLYLTE